MVKRLIYACALSEDAAANGGKLSRDAARFKAAVEQGQAMLAAHKVRQTRKKNIFQRIFGV